MFPRLQGLDAKFRVAVVLGANHHQLNVRIGKEVIGGAVVLGIWVIDGAVRAWLDAGLVGGGFGALQESIYFQIGIGKDEGQVEALGRKAVANDTNIDGTSHGCWNLKLFIFFLQKRE